MPKIYTHLLLLYSTNTAGIVLLFQYIFNAVEGEGEGEKKPHFLQVSGSPGWLAGLNDEKSK